jgi:hypothetical protein
MGRAVMRGAWFVAWDYRRTIMDTFRALPGVRVGERGDALNVTALREGLTDASRSP